VFRLLAVLALAAAQPAALERQAYRAYQSREWAAAARLYESLHAAAPGSDATYDNLGVALINLARWEQAERALEKAVTLNPRHRWAYNHLGFVYREQGRHEEAAEMFRRQIEISPKDPYAYRNLAGLYARLGRLDEADRTAAAHERRTYERGAVYIDIACQLISLNRAEQAKKYLEEAERAGAGRALVAQETAHYFLSTGDQRGAEQQYLLSLEYQPYEPAVALRLAMLYFNTGNLDQAAAAFARVLSVDQRDQVTIRTSASASRIVPLAELRQDAGAARTLLGDMPVELGRAALLVRLESRRKLYTESRSVPLLVWFRAAWQELVDSKLSPEAEGWARDALGWLLLEDGQTAAARAELERAHVLAPGRRMIAYHFGVALEKSGELEKALDLYTRSLEPLPDKAIDCACEQPDLAAREKIARSLHVRLKGEEADFEAFRRALR